MSVIKMLFLEAWQRKGNLLLSLFTVSIAVALFIALLTLNIALRKATTRQMKELGFNLVILPQQVTQADYFNSEYGACSMPEEYVDKLAAAKQITADHFSGRLEKKIEWAGRTVILTGLLGTRVRGRKKPLGFRNPPSRGSAFFGFDAARSVKVIMDKDGRAVFDDQGGARLHPVTILGRTFKVKRRLAHGNIRDDMRIYINAHEMQEMLGKQGRINVIEALGCRCKGDVVALIAAEVEKLLNHGAPENDRVKVMIPDNPKFYTREKMRAKVEGYAALVMPMVLLTSLIWVGALSYMNVRQRRKEIGLLRAVGVDSCSMAMLFLGKAALVGIIGAGAGFAAGYMIAIRFGPPVFELGTEAIHPMWSYLLWSLIVSPMLAVMASALPAMLAVVMDPAEALREE